MGQGSSDLGGSAQSASGEIPQITAHPADFRGPIYRVVSGKPAKFSVNASGPGPLKYNWEWSPIWEEKDLLRIKGQTASNALREHIVDLTKYMNPEEVAKALFAKKIIDGEALYKARMPLKTPNQRATELLQDLIVKVQAKPEWFEMACKIFEKENLVILDELKAQYDKQLQAAEKWKPLDSDLHSSNVLSLGSVWKENQGRYRCVVSNHTGIATSNPITLSVVEPLQLNEMPQHQMGMSASSNVAFTVKASGMEPIVYYWEWKPATVIDDESSWIPLSPREGRLQGLNTSTLTIANALCEDEGRYRCQISNVTGSVTSDEAILKLAVFPQVITHPQVEEEVARECRVSFCIEATGTEPMQYMWEWKPAEEPESSTDGWQPVPNDAERIEGANTPKLVIHNTQESDAGSYRCVMRNSSGSTASNLGSLAILNTDEIVSRLVHTCSNEGKTTDDKVAAVVAFVDTYGSRSEAAQKGLVAIVRMNTQQSELVNAFLQKSVPVQFKENGFSPLHWACEMGYAKIALSLLTHGANKHEQTEDGSTPLHLAAQWAHDRVVAVLLFNQVDVNATDGKRRTALHRVCEAARDMTTGELQKFLTIVENLLNQDARMDILDEELKSPLHIVCEVGNTALVKRLLKHVTVCKSALYCRDKHGNTPLHTACSRDSHDVVDELLKSGADTSLANKENNTPLHVAILSRHPDVARKLAKLMKHNMHSLYSQNKDGNTPLHLAAANGYSDNVAKILKYSSHLIDQPNGNGDTPLHLACQGGNRETIENILKKGADATIPNKAGQTPRMVAAINGHRELSSVEGLITTHQFRRKLHQLKQITARLTGAQVTKVAGANSPFLPRTLFQRDQSCSGPLDISLPTQHVESPTRRREMPTQTAMRARAASEALLTESRERGAKLLAFRKACDDGDTGSIKNMIQEFKADSVVVQKVLMYVVNADEEHADIVKIFIACNVPLNFEHGGWTPLQCACTNGFSKTVWHLLEGGARKDIKTVDGRTLLHLACEEANSEVVSFLLFDNMGISTNDQDKLLKTSLHLACEAATKVVSVPTCDGSSSGILRRRAAYTEQQSISMEEKELLILIRNLLDNQARRDMQDEDGNTPIHLAVKSGVINVLDELLKGTAQCRAIDLQNKLGDTPLHMAATKGFYDMTKLLVERGANTELLNQDGQMVVQLAELNGHSKIVHYYGRKRKSIFY